MVKMTEEQWLADGRYLPAFMRDFHAQKDVFKWVWRRAAASQAKRKAEDGVDCLDGMTWVSAHIFVIDYFLWFMARHGYTLQPIRKEWPQADWAETIREMKDEDAAAFRKMLDSRDIGA